MNEHVFNETEKKFIALSVWCCLIHSIWFILHSFELQIINQVNLLFGSRNSNHHYLYLFLSHKLFLLKFQIAMIKSIELDPKKELQIESQFFLFGPLIGKFMTFTNKTTTITILAIKSN